MTEDIPGWMDITPCVLRTIFFEQVKKNIKEKLCPVERRVAQLKAGITA
ncbi:MAG TPA: hypothetical protein VK152_10555 [Paludibacter sp.]|nr:hypothetical protein [Paludibacter sp.]